MKHLKNFILFLEDIEVKPTDPTALKNAKNVVNTQKKYIDEFNSNKSKIDTIFKTIKDDSSRKKLIDKLLDNLQKNNSTKSRNPFLSEYTQISEWDVKVKELTDNLILDQSNLPNVVDPDKKKELTKNISQKNLQINDYKKKIADAQIKLKEKMQDTSKLSDEAWKTISAQK
jgi:hypothetical protein